MKFISESEFFLCMPGSSMPLCYHLIEACLVGTIPILSYNDFLFPKLTDNEALFYFNKTQLLKSINDYLRLTFTLSDACNCASTRRFSAFAARVFAVFLRRSSP